MAAGKTCRRRKVHVQLAQSLKPTRIWSGSLSNFRSPMWCYSRKMKS